MNTSDVISNNKAELFAIYVALKEFEDENDKLLCIFTDSSYSLEVLSN